MEMPTAIGDEVSGGPRERVRFGPFEVQLRTGELWREGELVRLQHQPFRVLATLVSRPGELVTREELRREIWPEGTFVDFESSLNFCVRHIRAALGDQASSPTYIETLPRRGYRFIAPVEFVGDERPASVAPAVPPPDTPRTSRAGLAAIAAALVVLLAVVAAALHTRPAPTAAPEEVRFQRLTFRRGFVDSARFAPGGLVLYAAGWEGTPPGLHLLNAALREDQDVPLEVEEVLATTTDGEVLYRTSTFALRRVSLRGGPPKDLALRVLAADATPDGNEVAVARAVDGRVQIEFPAGQVLGHARAVSRLRISPDRSRVAFLEHPFGDDDRGDVVVLDRAGRRTALATGWSSTTGLAWSPDGREVWFTAAAVGVDCGLHAVDLQGRRRTLVPALGRLVIHDVAADGRVLVERNSERIETRVGGAGEPERDISWLDATLVTDMSADGRRVLLVETGEGGGSDYSIFLRDLDAAAPVRVGPGRPMALSPDGRWVASVLPRAPESLQLLPVGPGTSRSLRHADGAHVEAATFLGGDRLLYTVRDADGRRSTWVRAVAGGPPRAVGTRGAMVVPVVAPDQRAVVFATPEGPRLVTLDGSRPPVAPPSDRGRIVGWIGPDLVVREDGWLPVILTRVGPGGTRTPLLQLAPDDRSGVVSVGNVVLSDDGRRYAYSLYRRASDLYVLTGLGSRG